VIDAVAALTLCPSVHENTRTPARGLGT
jgi:hypothetical protein